MGFRHGALGSGVDNSRPSSAPDDPPMKRLLLSAAALLLSFSASAEYPEKPVTIVVPFAAGGPTDKVARDLAEAMRKPLGGQSIIIDNVGGAGGTLGAAKVA